MFVDRSAKKILLPFWALFSFAGLALSGFFFGYYFIPIIPPLCLLSAYAFDKIFRAQLAAPKIAFFSIIFILSLVIIVVQYPFYLTYTPQEISSNKYLGDPRGMVAQKVAEELIKGIKMNDPISSKFFPQIYFYTQTRYPGRFFCDLCFFQGRAALNFFGLFKIEADQKVESRLPEFLLAKITEEDLILKRQNKYKIMIDMIGKGADVQNIVRSYKEENYRFLFGSLGDYGCLVFKNENFIN